jgi:hypothetical protein
MENYGYSDIRKWRSGEVEKWRTPDVQIVRFPEKVLDTLNPLCLAPE